MTTENGLCGIDQAISEAGSQARLAVSLGVTQQAISHWARQGWVPLRRAAEIEHLFDIPRHRLVSPEIVSALLPIVQSS
jgi:hypothetical protein